MRALAFIVALTLASVAGAADNVLLIQLRTGGGFTVWHTEGESQLSDEEAMELEATAKPSGGAEMQTGAGPARAYETPDGVMIRLPAARTDKTLLLDRDNCGHIRLWHGSGTTALSDDQIADVFMSALPGGGKRLTVGDMHVKAFITPLGVTATLWKVPTK
ncbi:MAG: hypothetical protein HZA63_16310 [Rhodocyclales bacterium]|nr:hypothetical protein [Rhodocyclales bacterium]